MADAAALVSIVGQETVSGPANAAARALSGIEGAAGRVGGALAGIAATAAKTALALGAIAATGVAGALTASVGAAQSFEKQISAIGAVSGATAEQLKELQTLALQLGADTSFSASEAAQGIEELVKAGVSMSDVMGGAAKASLDLAAAGAVSVADAAEIASNALNVFGLKGADMAHVADQIAGAANASAISVNDYKFSLAAAGAVAATVGVGFEDLTTAIAVMGQAGIKGSDAGTSLKTMLLNLTPSTKAQIAAARELGILTEDGGNKFFDASGKAKSLADIAGVLQDATKNLTQEQKLQALQTLFGTDAIRAAAIMANEGAEGFREMAAAIGQVTAADVANARLDNLAGSIEKFKGSAETAAITVGLKFTPILKRLVDQATEVLNNALPALERFAEQGAAAFDGLITRAQKAAPQLLSAGGAALAFGRNLLTMAQGALPVVVREFDRLRGLFEARGGTGGIAQTIERLRDGFRDLAPVALSIGRAIADNVVGTFQFLTQRVLPPVMSMLTQAATVVQSTLLPAFTATGQVMRGIFGDTLDWLATTVMPPFLSIVRQTTDWFTTVMLPTLPAVAASLRTTLGETVAWLAEDVWPKLRTAATVAWTFISGTIAPALPGLARQLRTLLGGALEWIGTTGWPMLVDGARTAAAFFTGTLVPAVTQAVDWLGPKISTAVTWLTDTGWPTLVSAGQAVSTWVTGTAIPALTQLWDWLSPKLAAAANWLIETGWPMLVSAGTAVSSWFLDTLVPALSAAWDWLSPKLSAAATFLSETAWPALVEAGTAVSTWITGTAVPAFQTFVEWLDPKMQAAVTWITDTGWPAMLKIGQELVTMWEQSVKWVTDLWTQLADTKTWDNLTEAGTRLWEAGKTLVEVFWPGMKDGAEKSFIAVEPFVKLIEGASYFLLLFAAGLETIAKGFKAIKDNMPGELPDWLRRILPNVPSIPSVPGMPGLPFGPGVFMPQSSGSSFQTSPLASKQQWTEEDVRATQQRILTEMPKPPAFDPNKSEAERMREWAPTLQWLEANTGVAAASWAGLIHAENRFGESALSAQGNNYLSLTRSPYDTLANPGTDRFPTYPTAEANIARGFGIIAHPENTNYNAAWASRNDPEAFAQNLARGGYMVDEPGFPTSNWITNSRAGRELYQQNVGATQIAAVNMSSGGTSRASAVNLSQTQQQWSQMANDANAICGPYLASLFADAVGRPPTAEEARTIAERFGIYNSSGTGSGILNAGQFDEYATAMIQQLNPGTTARVEQQMGVSNSQAQSIAAGALSAGSGLVGFNTQGHYFGADAFDPSTGKFHVGGTGLSLRGGSEWMTIDEMTDKMGGLIGVLTLVGVEGEATGQAMAPLGATLNETGAAGQAAAAGMAPIGSTAQEASDGLSTLTDAAGPVAEAVVGMAREAVTSVTQMGDGIMTTVTDTAGNTITTMTDLNGQVTSQVAQMADGSVLKMGDMASGILTSTTDLGTGVMTVVQDMSGNYITTITDMAGNVVNQYVQMANGTSTQMSAMAQTSTAQAVTLKDGVVAEMVAMSEGMGEVFAGLGEIAETSLDEAAETAADAARRMGEQMNEAAAEGFEDSNALRRAVQDAWDEALEDFEDAFEGAGDEDKGGSRSGSSGLGRRAAGGPVWAGRAYVVGEYGPELFAPSVSGTIIPNHRLGSGQDGGIDYERLAAAIAGVMPPRQVNNFNGMTYEQAFDEAARRQRVQDLLRGAL